MCWSISNQILRFGIKIICSRVRWLFLWTLTSHIFHSCHYRLNSSQTTCWFIYYRLVIFFCIDISYLFSSSKGRLFFRTFLYFWFLLLVSSLLRIPFFSEKGGKSLYKPNEWFARTDAAIKTRFLSQSFWRETIQNWFCSSLSKERQK